MYEESFREILTNLYNGNKGSAIQDAEKIPCNIIYSITDEFQKQRQSRANYEALILKKYLGRTVNH